MSSFFSAIYSSEPFLLLPTTFAVVSNLDRQDKPFARDDRRRLFAISALILAAAIFWSEFEQAGSTLNLFGDRATLRLDRSSAERTVAEVRIPIP